MSNLSTASSAVSYLTNLVLTSDSTAALRAHTRCSLRTEAKLASGLGEIYINIITTRGEMNWFLTASCIWRVRSWPSWPSWSQCRQCGRGSCSSSWTRTCKQSTKIIIIRTKTTTHPDIKSKHRKGPTALIQDNQHRYRPTPLSYRRRFKSSAS